ncbi:hypothetical protein [Mesorhizobium sp.]|uniref:hypothetical protein n=1 Tax=Mesorhizobium sp. TaxID=1871066 RepID=UPI00257E02F7|nr:hypothetical protein [Mesorhizobium sp.]
MAQALRPRPLSQIVALYDAAIGSRFKRHHVQKFLNFLREIEANVPLTTSS